VKSTVEGTPCHRCGKMTTQLYGEDREITLRHLPILGRKTCIRLRQNAISVSIVMATRPPPRHSLGILHGVPLPKRMKNRYC
jgi:hypothetical protein